MRSRKVVAIGIDGGEMSIFHTMINKGLMPNLATIIKNNFVANIDTSVKASGQGWASFITCKSPEKHNVYYWTLYKTMVNSDFIKDKFLWEILGENGIRSCVINMSYTYPPRSFNGFMLSGLGSDLSESMKLQISYPASLLTEIVNKTGDYILAGDYKDGSIHDHMQMLTKLIRMTEYRTKACKYIMETYSPDFLLVVYRGADLIQHSYWNLLNPEFKASEGGKQLQKVIDSYYKQLDKSIGQLWHKYDNSISMILSDHGFGPVKAIVYLNHYLEEKGILLREQSKEDSRRISFSGVIKAPLKFIYNKSLKNYDFFRKLNRIRKEMLGVDLPINKIESLAYSDVLNGVNMNRKSPSFGNADKLRHKIMTLLKELKDPHTNQNIMEKVYFKENSHARNSAEAPDIIFEANESYLVTYEMLSDSRNIFRYMDKEETAFFTGSHRRAGIFIIDTSSLNHQIERKDIDITDVSATILDLFDVPIPADIDGKVIYKK
ncbi:MAG: alkaline phosphatase family protein [Thermodesulfovibrionales bacterium]